MSDVKKRVFDERTKNLLAGMMPFKQGATVEIRFKEFEFLPEAERPVFVVKTFSEETRKRLLDKSNSREINASEWQDAMFEAVRDDGLMSWKNMVDLGSDEVLPFTKDNVESLRSSTLIVKLYTRIAEFCGLLQPDREGLVS